MKIFVTGATGYLGSAVAAELQRAGHEISAARRSEEELGWVPEQASYRDGVEVAYREWQRASE